MTIHSFRGKSPEIDASVFVARGAQVIGDVTLAPGSSVWFNAVLRGDTERIIVGEGSNIQDGTVVHADPGFPCTIGRNVIVGHGAILHGCEIGDGCLIGMGAIILNGAKLGEGCIVAAGSVVPEVKEFPPRSLLMGVPAAVRRTVTDEELASTLAGSAHYRERASIYRAEQD